VNEPSRGASISLIANLASNDPKARKRAAAAIFALGRRQALVRAEKWLSDSELTKQFLLTRLDVPRITVGIAVEPPTFDQIRAANGSPRLADVPPDIDAREFELQFPEDVRIDVLTSREAGGDGPLSRFLKKFGEGIQQVEMEVKDVERTSRWLEERQGLAPVYPKPRAGADRTRVNFFLVADESGTKLLIELVEVESKKRSPK
jgi:hypothetical protein